MKAEYPEDTKNSYNSAGKRQLNSKMGNMKSKIGDVHPQEW